MKRVIKYSNIQNSYLVPTGSSYSRSSLIHEPAEHLKATFGGFLFVSVNFLRLLKRLNQFALRLALGPLWTSCKLNSIQSDKYLFMFGVHECSDATQQRLKFPSFNTVTSKKQEIMSSSLCRDDIHEPPL